MAILPVMGLMVNSTKQEIPQIRAKKIQTRWGTFTHVNL